MKAAHHQVRWNLSQRHDKNCSLYFKQKPDGTSPDSDMQKERRHSLGRHKAKIDDGTDGNRAESPYSHLDSFTSRRESSSCRHSQVIDRRALFCRYVTYHYRNERGKERHCAVDALKVVLFRNTQSAGLSPLLALSWNNGDIISRMRPIKRSSLFVCSNTHG